MADLDPIAVVEWIGQEYEPHNARQINAAFQLLAQHRVFTKLIRQQVHAMVDRITREGNELTVTHDLGQLKLIRSVLTDLESISIMIDDRVKREQENG